VLAQGLEDALGFLLRVDIKGMSGKSHEYLCLIIDFIQTLKVFKTFRV
jgi:hypothetical protein